MQLLTEKTAFITGAGKGIGRATALALANEGVNVGLIARTESDLVKLAAEIKSLRGRVAYAVADVSDLTQVEAAIEKLTNEIGTADILINNAGIGKYAPFLELQPEEWKRMIDVNLMGMYYVTRTVLPQLIEKNGGDIINISSSSGLRGTVGSSAYSASKFGVLGMTESLSQEVRKHNIRVFALTPSRVVTDLTYKEGETEEEKEKFMHPEDLAEYMVAQLKLHPRIFIPTSSQWATNPF
ncbi:3-oxoacyl-[acyl-carrier protein] reductase [Planococcus halocryophilus Or1]|uniref:3-ketoacyl-ACP reductase n=1 Tax=Planococcus halocryophilus TaxID=1215089 RepID=A0A1C7DNE5_9BACL|nr:3-ketoacyl-ACP reductase [Planococcus halocryophilus]ANU13120.1 3-ketoacyl-ACP reductase [Planococcus halocryophilus]EMF47922.1 3-oxoacyl-[acyl-carrier protein] reductase [Planococcus halocryophilus Or1]